MCPDFDLPEVRTKLYHDFINELCLVLRKELGIKVYGYSDYSVLSFHWCNEKGEMDENNPCSMSFSTALRLYRKFKDENKNDNKM